MTETTKKRGQFPAEFPPKKKLQDLESVKWYLWHENIFRALEMLDLIEEHLEIVEGENDVAHKLLQTVHEFKGHIEVNHGERYCYGEAISTAFVESAINWIVSKRMVKKQQMRWTKRGAHLLFQTRTATLNGDLRDIFCNWYSAMTQTVENLPLAAQPPVFGGLEPGKPPIHALRRNVRSATSRDPP